jgi:hypothetical protein
MAAIALEGVVYAQSRLTGHFPFEPPFTKTDDHVDEAIANLIEQFKNKPVIAGYLTAWVNQIQDLEDAAFDTLVGRLFPYAEGAQLDGIGRIVGEDRGGRTDIVYREALNARVLINKCEGTPEQIIEIFELLTNQEVELLEYYPAALELTIPNYVNLDEFNPARMSGYLNGVKPAGVLAHLVYHPFNPFQFDTGLGFDQGHWGGAL